ncbi:putative hydrolase [Thozetella sp. PMI_491]|nr:putative hydrolase [Thozetella sp. PMI_491]
MPVSECCVEGALWQGTPQGKEQTLANNNTYVTGNNPDAAILLIHDLFGWTFRNIRILADAYAREVGATVYVPDFFGGEIIDPTILLDATQRSKLDLPAFMRRNSKETRTAEIFECAKALKSQYKRVGALGFCFGGWAVFRLGAKTSENLVACISTAHPSLLEKGEIDNVRVPVQVLAPEIDPQFTPELKQYANQVIPTLSIPYDYQHFPGVEHAFAVRGDSKNEAEYQAMLRAKAAATSWFRFWLHES